jgi:hypothetical protein
MLLGLGTGTRVGVRSAEWPFSGRRRGGTGPAPRNLHTRTPALAGRREKKSDESDMHLLQPPKKSSYLLFSPLIFLIAFLGVL